MDHHSEENYFISMTDMMVGILFIFIIMVAFFAFKIQSEESIPKPVHVQKVDDLNKTITTLEEELERLRLLLNQVNQYEVYAKKTLDVRERVILDIQTSLRKEGVSAYANVAQGVITIPGDTLFASGSSNLDELPQAKQKMYALSRILADKSSCFVFKEKQPNNLNKICNKDNVFIDTIFIEGHTDSLPVGKRLKDGSGNNLELSSKRATNSYEVLVANTPEFISFKNPSNQQVLSVSAYGEQRPVQSNTTRTGRQENRRIDIRFLMFMPKNQIDLKEFQKRFGEQ